jgi:DNA-binding transcriptional regulator YhcF (GntR family)
MSNIIVKWTIYVNQGGYLLPKFVSKGYTTNSYTFYENTHYKLALLNKVEYLFFHFVCEKMDESNNIVHTKALRTEFLSHAGKNLNLTYQDDTIKKAFAKLVKVGLIINYDVKSDFTVNPRHVFKSSEKRRASVIQAIINQLIKLKYTKSNFKSALGIK